MLPDIDDKANAEKASITELETAVIRPNPFQPRREFREAELEELTASIREKGVIQPLVVRKTADAYELIAGERRLRAATRAGVKLVPVRILVEISDLEMLELSLIENLQRHDLNPIELADGYRQLQSEWNLTQEQIAQKVGKERATVANSLRLLELPEAIRNSLRRGEISTGHAKAILSLDGAARQSALWKRVLAQGLSVRQTEELAKALKSDPEAKSARTESPSASAAMLDFTDRMRRALGTQVKINKRGRKGSIRIEFYSEEELERLVDMLASSREKRF